MLVADRFEAKFHYAMWFKASSELVADGSKLVGDEIRTSFESASVMEFGF